MGRGAVGSMSPPWEEKVTTTWGLPSTYVAAGTYVYYVTAEGGCIVTKTSEFA